MVLQLNCTLVKALTKQEEPKVFRDAASYALVEKNDLKGGNLKRTKRSALMVLSGL